MKRNKYAMLLLLAAVTILQSCKDREEITPTDTTTAVTETEFQAQEIQTTEVKAEVPTTESDTPEVSMSWPAVKGATQYEVKMTNNQNTNGRGEGDWEDTFKVTEPKIEKRKMKGCGKIYITITPMMEEVRSKKAVKKEIETKCPFRIKTLQVNGEEISLLTKNIKIIMLNPEVENTVAVGFTGAIEVVKKEYIKILSGTEALDFKVEHLTDHKQPEAFVLTFTPAKNKEYTATISKSLINRSGTALKNDITFNFKTGEGHAITEDPFTKVTVDASKFNFTEVTEKKEIQKISFSWEAVAEATGYEVEIKGKNEEGSHNGRGEVKFMVTEPKVMEREVPCGPVEIKITPIKGEVKGMPFVKEVNIPCPDTAVAEDFKMLGFSVNGTEKVNADAHAATPTHEYAVNAGVENFVIFEFNSAIETIDKEHVTLMDGNTAVDFKFGQLEAGHDHVMSVDFTPAANKVYTLKVKKSLIGRNGKSFSEDIILTLKSGEVSTHEDTHEGTNPPAVVDIATMQVTGVQTGADKKLYFTLNQAYGSAHLVKYLIVESKTTAHKNESDFFMQSNPAEADGKGIEATTPMEFSGNMGEPLTSGQTYVLQARVFDFTSSEWGPISVHEIVAH